MFVTLKNPNIDFLFNTPVGFTSLPVVTDLFTFWISEQNLIEHSKILLRKHIYQTLNDLEIIITFASYYYRATGKITNVYFSNYKDTLFLSDCIDYRKINFDVILNKVEVYRNEKYYV